MLAVARTRGVSLPANAFPPYPENIDQMTTDQVRALVNMRRVPKPANAPDLTADVVALLDERYAAVQAATAATRHTP